MGDGSGWKFDPNGPILNAGTTYHIVATYDGTNARIYLNGNLVSTSPNVTMAPNNGANVMRFGAYSTGPGQYWPGTLDEASFYSAVLTRRRCRPYQASATGSQATSAATAVVVPAPDSPPVNSSPPVVSGVAQVGQIAVGVAGVVVGDGADLVRVSVAALQPRLCDLGGASSRSYTVVGADLGATLRVVVTASNSAGSASAARRRRRPWSRPARPPSPLRSRRRRRWRRQRQRTAVGRLPAHEQPAANSSGTLTTAAAAPPSATTRS